jgi:hypothetical protein
MIKNLKDFGYNVYGKTIGEAWISLVESIIKYGKISYDENRKRLALMNVRVKSKTQIFNDEIIRKYAEKDKLKP